MAKQIFFFAGSSRSSALAVPSGSPGPGTTAAPLSVARRRLWPSGPARVAGGAASSAAASSTAASSTASRLRRFIALASVPMPKLSVKLPDGSDLRLPEGATGADAAGAIGPGLARDALAVRVDGEVRDLTAGLDDGESIEILTAKSPGTLDVLRHDAAHVMATAVVELWPGTKVSIGPPIKDGFYYDFEFPEDARPGEDDLARIEQRMAAHIAADEAFERRELPVADAVAKFRDEGQPYKVELIEDLVRDEGV